MAFCLVAGAGVCITVTAAAANIARVKIAGRSSVGKTTAASADTESSSTSDIATLGGFNCFMGRAQKCIDVLERPLAEDERLPDVDVAKAVCQHLYAAAECNAVINEEVASSACSTASEALGHGLRGFLRERRSGKYLTVVEGAKDPACMATDKAASLFICRCAEAASEGNPTPVAFEHEGIPALGRFLSCKAPRLKWKPNRLPLKCAGRGFSGQENFLWHPDSTIQHKPTGLWLSADADTSDVVLHATAKSAWDIVSAL